METTRNWLLPVLLAAGQGALMWLAPGQRPMPGPTALIGVLCALAGETVALGRRRQAPVRALAGTLSACVLGTVAWPDGYPGLATVVAVYSVAVRCPVPVTVRAVTGTVGVEWALSAVQDGLGVSLQTAVTALGVYVLCVVLGEPRQGTIPHRRARIRRSARTAPVSTSTRRTWC
ncbi:hypothetical protein ACWC19_41020, partial [Streptomyces sp. 900105245]